MLTAQEQAKLQSEIQVAEKARFAFEQYFSAFFEQKEVDLINAFRSAPVGDVKALSDIQCLFKAMDALKRDLIISIETGMLAEVTLAENRGQLQ